MGNWPSQNNVEAFMRRSIAAGMTTTSQLVVAVRDWIVGHNGVRWHTADLERVARKVQREQAERAAQMAERPEIVLANRLRTLADNYEGCLADRSRCRQAILENLIVDLRELAGTVAPL